MTERIAVVGAGFTGCHVAARLADAGLDVTVYDKSRGVGGRLATRRTEAGSFDHGAPLAHCHATALQPFIAAGSAIAWDDGALGLPGMSGLVRPVASTLRIVQPCELTGLETRDDGIWLFHAEGSEGPFDRVISTIPAPQAIRFAAGDAAAEEALSEVVMAPVWTLLAAFPEHPGLPDLLCPGGAFSLVFRNAARPGREGETWVAHAGHGWTRDRLELGKADAAEALLAELSAIAGRALPVPLHADAHRWRYALTERPLGRAHLSAHGGRCLFGGDWALGPRVEHAWLSAEALADAVLG